MPTKRATVIFDCERMKYPNTGLYVFGKELVAALQKEAIKRGKEFMVYARERTLKEWNLNIPRKKPFTLLDKHFLYMSSEIGLWHSPFQQSRCVPVNKKVLLTVHDLNFLYELPEKMKEHRLKKLQRATDRATHIVAISHYVKEDIVKHLNIRDKEISVIYNGCSIFRGTLQAPSTLPKGKFLFAVGTVLPKKNFHVLPCLLQDNDYELIIAGEHSEYEHQILEEAQAYGVGDRVKILGPIPEAEKHWYYKNCEAFLFPSIAEGFGLPVIEAMYYEKPLFLSTHTSLPEIGGNYAFYFNHLFERKLMQQEFRTGMEAFRKGAIQKGMQSYALSFSWENAARQYWDIYEKFLIV